MQAVKALPSDTNRSAEGYQICSSIMSWE